MRTWTGLLADADYRGFTHRRPNYRGFTHRPVMPSEPKHKPVDAGAIEPAVDNWRGRPLFGSRVSGFHPPWRRGITHRTIGVSHTESRGFTHRVVQQVIDWQADLPPFCRLNLFNDSYLTESLNVKAHPET